MTDFLKQATTSEDLVAESLIKINTAIDGLKALPKELALAALQAIVTTVAPGAGGLVSVFTKKAAERAIKELS